MSERSIEQQARLEQLVDGLPASRLIQIMNETVGIKRTAELLGWAVLWGLQGQTSGLALRRKMESQGLTYSTAYRAIQDYQRVSDALLALDEYQGKGLFETLNRLAATVAL
jgi:hypothetical protein